MTPEQIKEIAKHLAEVPLADLQKASLKYAAMRLKATGEKNLADAVLLLEQLATDTILDEDILT